MDGQCIPRETPEPFRGVSENEVSEVLDVSQPMDFGADALVEDAAPTQDANLLSPFSDYDQILLVDRTEVPDSRATPALPGSDIDAIIIIDESENVTGQGTRIIDEQVNDPFGANIQSDPRAVLGRPDGRAVSLGPQGFVRVQLSLDGPLRLTDRVRIVELEERPDDLDRYEAFICATDSEGLDGCRSWRGVAGRTSLLGRPVGFTRRRAPQTH